MKLAAVLITVDPADRVDAAIGFENVELPHFHVAAALLEEYARTPNRVPAQPGAWEYRGRSFDQNTEIALIRFADDAAELELHGAKLSVFQAISCAAHLRAQALAPVIQQAVLGALNARDQARAAMNGGEADIVRKILLPGG